MGFNSVFKGLNRSGYYMYHLQQQQQQKEYCCVHTPQHSGTTNSTSLYNINKQNSMVDTRCVLCEVGIEVL